MKSIIIFCFFICVCIHAFQQDDTESASSGNPYATDPKVKHSLYLDKNLWNRISGSDQGVPLKNKYQK